MLKKLFSSIFVTLLLSTLHLTAASFFPLTPSLELDRTSGMHERWFFTLPNPERKFRVIPWRPAFDTIRVYIGPNDRPLDASHSPSFYTWKDYFNYPSRYSDGLYHIMICQKQGEPFRIYLDCDGRLPTDTHFTTFSIANPLQPLPAPGPVIPSSQYQEYYPSYFPTTPFYPHQRVFHPPLSHAAVLLPSSQGFPVMAAQQQELLACQTNLKELESKSVVTGDEIISMQRLKKRITELTHLLTPFAGSAAPVTVTHPQETNALGAATNQDPVPEPVPSSVQTEPIQPVVVVQNNANTFALPSTITPSHDTQKPTPTSAIPRLPASEPAPVRVNAKEIRRQQAEVERKRKEEEKRNKEEVIRQQEEARKQKQREEAKERLRKQEEEKAQKKAADEKKERTLALRKAAQEQHAIHAAAKLRTAQEKKEREQAAHQQAVQEAIDRVTRLFETGDFQGSVDATLNPLLTEDFPIIARARALLEIHRMDPVNEAKKQKIADLRPHLETIAKNTEATAYDREMAWVILLDIFPENISSYYSPSLECNNPRLALMSVVCFFMQTRNFESTIKKLKTLTIKYTENVLNEYPNWYCLHAHLADSEPKALAWCDQGLQKFPDFSPLIDIKTLVQQKIAAREQLTGLHLDTNIVDISAKPCTATLNSEEWWDAQAYYFLGIVQQLKHIPEQQKEFARTSLRFLTKGDPHSFKHLVSRIILDEYLESLCPDEIVAITTQLVQLEQTATPPQDIVNVLGKVYYHAAKKLFENNRFQEALFWIKHACRHDRHTYARNLEKIRDTILKTEDSPQTAAEKIPEGKTSEEYAQMATRSSQTLNLKQAPYKNRASLINAADCMKKSDLSIEQNFVQYIQAEHLLAIHCLILRLTSQELDTFISQLSRFSSNLSTTTDRLFFLLALAYIQEENYMLARNTLQQCSKTMKETEPWKGLALHLDYVKDLTTTAMPLQGEAQASAASVPACTFKPITEKS